MKKTLVLLSILFIVGCTAPECGIENCHGIEITCGPNVAKVCTEIYMVGDFCRLYANCASVNGACSLQENPEFSLCKNCINNCTNKDFDCENKCLTKMSRFCVNTSDCACGTNVYTNDCFYGNKKFVNTTIQCPDYCTGLDGRYVLECINNTCTHYHLQ